MQLVAVMLYCRDVGNFHRGRKFRGMAPVQTVIQILGSPHCAFWGGLFSLSPSWFIIIHSYSLFDPKVVVVLNRPVCGSVSRLCQVTVSTAVGFANR